MRPGTRSLLVGLLVALVALGALLAYDRHARKPLLNAHNDFTAFYCAGKVVDAHADPYRVEPLRACERAAYETPSAPAWEVTPAPFPGYVLRRRLRRNSEAEPGGPGSA